MDTQIWTQEKRKLKEVDDEPVWACEGREN